jgi:hypothetical protein
MRFHVDLFLLTCPTSFAAMLQVVRPAEIRQNADGLNLDKTDDGQSAAAIRDQATKIRLSSCPVQKFGISSRRFFT